MKVRQKPLYTKYSDLFSKLVIVPRHLAQSADKIKLTGINRLMSTKCSSFLLGATGRCYGVRYYDVVDSRYADMKQAVSNKAWKCILLHWIGFGAQHFLKA